MPRRLFTEAALAAVVVLAHGATANATVRWGALPVASLSADEGVTLGAVAQRFDYASQSGRVVNLLTFQSTYASRGPLDFFAEWESTDPEDALSRQASELYVFRNPSEPFYGIGPETSSINRPFRHEGARAGQSFQRKFWGNWALSAGLRWSLHQTAPENSSLHYTETRFRLVSDTRDSEFIPCSGTLLGVGAGFSPGLLGSASTWARFDGDARHFIRLIGDRWLTLGMQGHWAHATSDTPLFEKPRLGSRSTLRGLPLNRFIASSAVSLRAELRSVWLRTRIFNLPLKGGTGVFADAGRIADSPAALLAARTHSAGGASIFWSYFTDDFVSSADFAWSEEATTYYFSLGYAF